MLFFGIMRISRRQYMMNTKNKKWKMKKYLKLVISLTLVVGFLLISTASLSVRSDTLLDSNARVSGVGTAPLWDIDVPDPVYLHIVIIVDNQTIYEGETPIHSHTLHKPDLSFLSASEIDAVIAHINANLVYSVDGTTINATMPPTFTLQGDFTYIFNFSVIPGILTIIPSPTPTPTPEITPTPTPEVTPEPTPEITPEPTPAPDNGYGGGGMNGNGEEDDIISDNGTGSPLTGDFSALMLASTTLLAIAGVGSAVKAKKRK